MPNLTIPLSEQSMQRLQELAVEAGQTAEELLRAHVEQWLAPPEDFPGAAAYVLEKNAELYRRLAG